MNITFSYSTEFYMIILLPEKSMELELLVDVHFVNF